jgi:hypothetical protein
MLCKNVGKRIFSGKSVGQAFAREEPGAAREQKDH